MANTRTAPHGRRARRSATTPGLAWVSELQLDAYLEARDALRRARAGAALTSCQRPSPSRPAAS